MTDFRTLCAELVDCLEKANWPLRHKTVFGICLDDARAALTQPEPQGPTLDDVSELCEEFGFHLDESYDNLKSAEALWEMFRAVLQRWGNLATKPDGPAVPHGREPASVTHQPTDKELHRLMHSFVLGGESPEDFSFDHCGFARAALARWGRPAIKPVPVAERLPGPEDCDAEGRCWWWIVDQPGELPHWIYCQLEVLSWTNFTAWLPHHALPVPQ